MEHPSQDHMRALRTTIKALTKIRDGNQQREPDGTTVMIDWPPGVAAGIAGAALREMGIED